MSGGRFNYACFKVEDEGVFEALPDVHMIENYLRGLDKHDAADEVLRFLNEAETHQRRLVVIGERIAGLLKAAEWTASGDSDGSYIDAEYFKLMGIDPPEGKTP